MAVEIFEMRAIDFWRDVLELVCGKGHGLRVAVYSSGDDECVEILGQLPATLKRGLRQAVLWNEPLKLGAKREGVLRRHLLESGRAVECVLYREDLLGAATVYLGNALRGLIPVTVLA